MVKATRLLGLRPALGRAEEPVAVAQLVGVAGGTARVGRLDGGLVRYCTQHRMTFECRVEVGYCTIEENIVLLFAGCLTSQQHASVSQGRICSDRFTCCHTEIEVADPTFYLTQSQYTDTGPTSPSADPISRAEDPGFESRLRRDFFGVESYQ